MISKKISDLKDINFEISTALQFEPSPLRELWSKDDVATFLTRQTTVNGVKEGSKGNMGESLKQVRKRNTHNSSMSRRNFEVELFALRPF